MRDINNESVLVDGATVIDPVRNNWIINIAESRNLAKTSTIMELFKMAVSRLDSVGGQKPQSVGAWPSALDDAQLSCWKRANRWSPSVTLISLKPAGMDQSDLHTINLDSY